MTLTTIVQVQIPLKYQSFETYEKEQKVTKVGWPTNIQKIQMPINLTPLMSTVQQKNAAAVNVNCIKKTKMMKKRRGIIHFYMFK